MADQSRPIPVNNEEVVEIIQALQPNVDNATNNPVSEAASAFSGPANSQQDSPAASRQDSVNSQAPGNSEKTDCLVVVREQREDLDIRPTQGGEAFRYRVWLCAHTRGEAVCPLRGVALCPPKRCGCVPTQERCDYVPTKGCGCVPTQEVRLCVHSSVAVCLPKRCGCVYTDRCGWVPTKMCGRVLTKLGWVPTKMSGGVFTEVWLWAHEEMWLCAHKEDAACKEIPRKPNAPHRKYSKLEDQLILKAVELKGRDWRAVLAFLKRNCEVLGQEGKLYRDCDIGDKSIHDRLRKRASTFLRKPKEKEAEVSKIEDEFHTVDDILQSSERDPGSAEEESTGGISDEIEEILGKVNQRDEKYRLDADEQLEGASASNIIEGIKRRSKSDREEHGQKKRKRGKGPATRDTTKLDSLLDQLPQFLATANQAAEAHTRALGKWEKKFGLASSSDTE
ncbi:hypothetical protein OS493_008588 [Desmophyllum pertusum]|uniref:Uncharacterized protein n=1 Tax=Desmophyllum pertusum TaxID=174260 RepID=A0A9X0D6A4_9CNID|nr:hypothetical protein OS493_008588 [Desmophyllum pertusum]